MCSSNSGTLTWAQFDKYCADFCHKASSLHDNWVYKKIKEKPGHSYLEKRVVLHLPDKGTVTMAAAEDVEAVEEPQEEDAHTLVTEATDEITSIYHVIYSQSYNVPVLYFNMFKKDGRLLTIEEIWNHVPAAYQEELRSNAWGAITQQEHPLMGIPYFLIHPCQTEKLMKSCLTNTHGSDSNYIICWLSMFGPIVGLQLPLSYGLLLNNASSSLLTNS